MRTFKKFPEESKCILCGGSQDGECILVAIDGTQEGHNIQATPVHTECIDLRYSPAGGAIYQRVDGLDATVSFFSLGRYSSHRSATRIIKEHLDIDPVINPYIYRIVY